MNRIRSQRGWSAAEYLAVLVGLVALWQGSRALVALFVEYHDEFCWALIIPL
jgi:hypothetical protein